MELYALGPTVLTLPLRERAPKCVPMDVLLLSLILAFTIFILRMIFVALGLRSAAKNPDAVDKTALREAQKGLAMHRELRRQAMAEPAKQLRAAKSQVADFHRLKTPMWRT